MVMIEASKKDLLNEIREAAGQRSNADSMDGLMRRWLECEDSQAAGNAFARSLSLQQSGDPVVPGPGIWPIPPA
jgi:hypothetical protein